MNMKKKRLLTILISLVSVCTLAQGQNIIRGNVCDEEGRPMVGANIYIYGTVDGCICDTLGNFSFKTSLNGEATLKCTFVGYRDYFFKITIPAEKEIFIKMKPQSFTLDNVDIVASCFCFGQTEKIKSIKPLDVVMMGNSCGDIIASLHALPGVQTVGENGKLYVRGGESFESQVFINGMHVLQPYDAEANNTVTRSRFSPFLFKGINFSLGGYDCEYGQALSSVLPMETTDVQTHDKFGLNFSPLSMAVGGTKSLRTSSLSFNAEYMDLKLYDKLFPDKYEWNKPYKKISSEVQYKAEPLPSCNVKTYVGFDHTELGYHIPFSVFDSNERKLGMDENNLYINSVCHLNFKCGWNLLAGAAESWIRNVVNGGFVANDEYIDRKLETHLKARFLKNIAGIYKLSFGAEDYIRSYKKSSNVIGRKNELSMDYNTFGVFVDNQLKVNSSFFLKASLRMENKVGENGVFFMPRTSITYIPNTRLQMSLLYGRYSQVVGDDFDIYGSYIKNQSFSNHYVLSFLYKFLRTTVRLETYLKQYSRLPLIEESEMTLNGKGKSYGLDFFLEDGSVWDNLTTTLSYSYNHTRRRYMEYVNYVQPQYATAQNLSVSVKYNITKIKCILGLSENIASGRPYTNPSESGKLQSLTKPYVSTGVNVSYLVSPSIIIYASITNLFNRHNVFNYDYVKNPCSDKGYLRRSVESSRDRFFYVGIFISLKKSHAYEISNF